MARRIQHRRGTAAQAASHNEILFSGERGYETDTKKWKTGDGVTAWNDLQYDIGGSETDLRRFVDPDDAVVSHVRFNSSGLIDSKGNAWTYAVKPPTPRKNVPQLAMAIDRKQVGPLSDANYFTQGTAGSHLANFAGSFTACFAVYCKSTSASNGPVIFDAGGWRLQSAGPGAGVYLIPGAGSALSKGYLREGLNIICCGIASGVAYIKLNDTPVVSGSVTYAQSGSAVATFGRYGPAATLAFDGWYDEAWFSTDVPSASALDALYAMAAAHTGSAELWLDTSGTTLHLRGRDYGTNWVTPQATLTKVGSPSSQTPSSLKRAITAKYAASPAGTEVVLNQVPLSLNVNSRFYRMVGTNNKWNFATSFTGVIVLEPKQVDITQTSIFCSSGKSQGNDGWQLVNEYQLTTFHGSTASIDDSEPCVPDRTNIVIIGFDSDAGKIWMKVNDGPTKSKSGIVTAISTSDAECVARIGMHVVQNIGFAGAIYEVYFTETKPSHLLFRNILDRFMVTE